MNKPSLTKKEILRRIILKYLRMRGVWVQRRKVGAVPGAADIEGILPIWAIRRTAKAGPGEGIASYDDWPRIFGLHFEIAVKRPGEDQSPAQLRYGDTLHKKGALYILATSIEDVVMAFKREQYVLR